MPKTKTVFTFFKSSLTYDENLYFWKNNNYLLENAILPSLLVKPIINGTGDAVLRKFSIVSGINASSFASSTDGRKIFDKSLLSCTNLIVRYQMNI